MIRSALDFKRWTEHLAVDGLGWEDICHRLKATKKREREFIRSHYFAISEGNNDADRLLPRTSSVLRH